MVEKADYKPPDFFGVACRRTSANPKSFEIPILQYNQRVKKGKQQKRFLFLVQFLEIQSASRHATRLPWINKSRETETGYSEALIKSDQHNVWCFHHCSENSSSHRQAFNHSSGFSMDDSILASPETKLSRIINFYGIGARKILKITNYSTSSFHNMSLEVIGFRGDE